MCIMSNQNLKKKDEDNNDLQKLRALEEQMRVLKENLNKMNNKSGRLDTDDLYELGRISEEIEYRDQLVDRLYKKKGFFYSMYVKMPLKIINLGSLSQSQRFVRDSYRGVSSPLCVVCNKGILMHSDNQVPVNGEVRWFCSKCDYKVWAKPASKDLLMLDIRKKIGVGMEEVGKNRWDALTEVEKADLIDSHQFESKLYRIATCVFVSLALLEALLQWWWAFLLTAPITVYTLVQSLYWAYRAWQIKTGTLFKPHAFINWLKTADKYYSLDWVDQDQGEQGEKNE